MASRLQRKGIELRNPDCAPSIPFENVWDEYLENVKKLLPHSTTCDMLGVDAEKYRGWILRYPRLRDAAKRARAEGIAEAQAVVSAGGQGWQAKMRILESCDPENWLRSSSAGRKANDSSPYSRALSGSKAKRGK